MAAEKVDDMVESFMGIRDMELGEVAREIHDNNLIGLPKYNAFRRSMTFPIALLISASLNVFRGLGLSY